MRRHNILFVMPRNGRSIMGHLGVCQRPNQPFHHKYIQYFDLVNLESAFDIDK